LLLAQGSSAAVDASGAVIPVELARAGKNCGTSALLDHEQRDCLVDDVIGRNDAMAYTFVVDNNGPPFTMLITLRTLDGVASMTVTLPNNVVLTDETVYTSQMNAVGESYIRLKRADVMSGLYRIDVRGMSALRGSMPMYLRVQSFGARTILNKQERVALSTIKGKCCKEALADDGTAPAAQQQNLCQLLDAALSTEDAESDVCQTANFVCNDLGQLTKLSLGGGSFKCPSFPKEFAKFPALYTLDVSFNDFGGDTLANVATTLQNSAALSRLMLRRAGFTGEFPCELFTGHALKTLMISYNSITGSLPPCVLESESIEELYMSRTNLTGQLPDVIPPNSQLRLWYSMNTMDSGSEKWPGGGFSGSIPNTLSNARYLRFLELSHHELDGSLPELPEKLIVLDLSNNQIEGTLPLALPADILMLDVANNRMTGRLPDFHTLKSVAIVDLGGNRFEGPLPLSFGPSTSSMTYFDARGMGVKGRLEETDWRPLTSLTYLTLRHNQLDGPVPASLGGLPNLMVLDLYNNSLSGDLTPFAEAIPVTIGDVQAEQQALDRGKRRLMGRDADLDESIAQVPLPVGRSNGHQFSTSISSNSDYSASIKSTGVAVAKVSAMEGDCMMHKRLVHEPLSQLETMLHLVHKKWNGAEQLLRGSPSAASAVASNAVTSMLGSRARRHLQQDTQEELKPDIAARPSSDTPDLNPTVPSAGVGITGLPYVPTTMANKLMYLDLSHNQLEGSLPDSLSFSSMFSDAPPSPNPQAQSNAPRMMDVSGNKLHGEVPIWLLRDAPEASSTCGCQTYFNISNNYLYCPTKASLEGFTMDESLNMALADLGMTCLLPSNEVVKVYDYMQKPENYITEIPDMPEGGYASTGPAYTARASSGSGGGGSPNPGAIAGIVIGVLAGVAVLGGLAFFLYKRHKTGDKMGFKTATSYRKVLPPKPQAPVQPKPNAAPPVLGGGFGRGHEI